METALQKYSYSFFFHFLMYYNHKHVYLGEFRRKIKHFLKTFNKLKSEKDSKHLYLPP